MVPVEPSSSAEAVKVVAPLGIPGWSQGNGAGDSSGHRVVVLLVNLSICPKLEATMRVVIEFMSRNECARTDSSGDSVGRWKNI